MIRRFDLNKINLQVIFNELKNVYKKLFKNIFYLDTYKLSHLSIIIISTISGSILFFFIYGFNFLYIEPLTFYDYDYLAYRSSFYAFANSDWTLPLFNSNKFFSDRSINLYLADYIPIYTIILKGLNISFLNENPFKIWIFISSIFTFYFSFNIFNQSKNINNFHKIIGSIILTTLPLSPLKYVFHSGEGAHWLILMGIFLYIKSIQNKNFLYLFSLLTAITLWVHFYIFSMLISIWLLSLLRNFKYLKTIIFSFSLTFLIITCLFLLSFGSLSNFTSILENEIMSEYNPAWSAETNSFFCGRSDVIFLTDFLKCYEPYSNTNYEAYAYFGLGIVIFLWLIFYEFNKSIKVFIQYKEIAALGLIFLIFSFGNRFKLAHKQIFEYNFSEFHYFLIKIYRAHSRFSYLVYYLVVIFIIFKISKFSKKNKFHKSIFYIFIIVQLFSVFGEFKTKEFLSYKVDFTNNTILNSTSLSIENLEERLYIYPPDNCYENNDMYLFAAEFIKLGGSIHSSRIRGGNNFENCENSSDIIKNLVEFEPVHFLINNDINLLPDSFLYSYTCTNIDGYFKDESIYYCG